MLWDLRVESRLVPWVYFTTGSMFLVVKLLMIYSLTSYNGELPSYFDLKIRKINNILDGVWYIAKYFVFLSNSLFEHVINLA